MAGGFKSVEYTRKPRQPVVAFLGDAAGSSRPVALGPRGKAAPAFSAYAGGPPRSQ